MRALIALFSIVVFLTACQPESTPNQTEGSTETKSQREKQQTESEKLNQWFAEKYEEQLQMSPIHLTFLGRKEQYDKIDDMTEASQKRQLEWQGKTVEEMKSKFDYNQLGKETKISYDIWVYQYEQAKEGIKFIDNGYIFTQMNGVQSFVGQFLINYHKVDNEADMKAYSKRIAGIAGAIKDLLDITKGRASKGVRHQNLLMMLLSKNQKT